MRAFWYLIASALEDDETQRRGVIIISYSVGTSKALEREGAWNIARLSFTIPMRVVGIHGCSDDPKQRLVMALVQVVIGTYLRVRSRIHSGKFPTVHR